MNRLILIGNGFDLAHGLKTSYKDFIHAYLRKAFEEAYTNHSYKDDFITINRNPKYIDISGGVSEYLDFYFEKGLKQLINNQPVVDENGQGYNPLFSVHIHSDFFKRIVTNCINANWVDIENEFYEDLKQIIYEGDDIRKNAQLKSLNESLGFIISSLNDYLETIGTKKHIDSYDIIFQSSIKASEIVERFVGTEMRVSKTLLLNFNYTSTIENYYSNENNPAHEINYIHGKLKSQDNPTIFGFGDELDEHYLKMELEKAKGFFKYIKSFWYFKTSNYYNLIRFIDSMPFQVFILGHSCGLSDRTMLNMIFEHENCKSIKIYYHGDKDNNSYAALTEEISRHFKNKAQMRRKIVSFDKSEPMPQVK